MRALRCTIFPSCRGRFTLSSGQPYLQLKNHTFVQSISALEKVVFGGANSARELETCDCGLTSRARRGNGMIMRCNTLALSLLVVGFLAACEVLHLGSKEMFATLSDGLVSPSRRGRLTF